MSTTTHTPDETRVTTAAAMIEEQYNNVDNALEDWRATWWDKAEAEAVRNLVSKRRAECQASGQTFDEVAAEQQIRDWLASRNLKGDELRADALAEQAAAQRIARANTLAANPDAVLTAVVHTCGHTGYHDFSEYRAYPTKIAREMNKKAGQVCSQCYKDGKQAEADAWENSQINGGRCAALLGTPNQISLAQSIRMQAITLYRKQRPDLDDPEAGKLWDRFEDAALACPIASVWCDVAGVILGRDIPGEAARYKHPILWVIVNAAEEYAFTQRENPEFRPLPPHPYQ